MIMQLPHATSPRRTLWSWLCDTVLLLDRHSGPSSVTTRAVQSHAAAPRTAAANGAAILPFPILGEALLVRLAAALRERVGECDANPLALTISRAPRARLTIDPAAYVEFHGERGIYHAVIEAAADTTVRLDTTDFDTLVRFVMQYVTDRPADTATLEAAS
ncbi:MULTISPECIES: hypothetical protein [unclassified Bradyrhizobium]|uniref:hypothetical protein n=1 Tax=unclassified Bradyrhizobium TaxID=2631580 RepID=UPI0020131636|nr:MULTISPECIES: hypothetical protein [unclassified Bradyrhizobium]